VAQKILVRAAAILLALAAAPAAADAERARELASTLCVACHGVDGNSVSPAFPKLAGLQPEYLAKQLVEYVDGRRTSDSMTPIVASISREDITPLALYFAAQKPSPGQPGDARLAEQGRRLFVDGNPDAGVPACMGCHLEDGSGNPRYPRLAGQHREYVLEQMRQFREGARTNDRGRVMRTLASRMTEAEMKAVAEYIAGM